MSQKEPGCFEFGEFRLLVRGGDLTFAGQPIKLTPKQAEVLTVLLKNAGSVVLKEDLLDEVWKDTFVEDANLSNCISELRKIFRAWDKLQKFIQTFPGRGYRFEIIPEICDDVYHETAPDRFVRRHGFFEDFSSRFGDLITKAKEITLFFIHSRRWRESNRHTLKTFLDKPEARLTVFLPNLDNRLLLGVLKNDFVDGPTIPQFVKDSYQDFATLYFDYAGKVSIRSYDHYPVYSFYKFDDLVIAAMYPNVAAKRQVPTFEIGRDSVYRSFFEEDLKDLLKIRPLTKKVLLELKNFNKKGSKNARVTGSDRLQQKLKHIVPKYKAR